MTGPETVVYWSTGLDVYSSIALCVCVATMIVFLLIGAWFGRQFRKKSLSNGGDI